MFLSGSFLGLSSFQYATGNIPLRRKYTKLRIYGNATIDKLQIRNVELDNTTIKNIPIANMLSWDSTTILAAEFENNLIAGNIFNLTDSVTQWQITRTDSSTSVLEILDTIDVSQVQYVDYTAQQNKTYTYDIFALTGNQISEPIQTASILTDFWGYYLVDPTIGTVYLFDLNVDTTVASNGNTYNEDVTIFDTYTQYPCIAMGERKYMSTAIAAVCGSISSTDGSLQQPIDYIETLRDFIMNGEVKLWKTRKSGIYSVFTHNFSFKPLNDAIGSQPMIVQFDIVEIGSV